MGYWIAYHRGPINGEMRFVAEFYEIWVDASLRRDVLSETCGYDVEIYEANTCKEDGCENHPDWGRYVCEECC